MKHDRVSANKNLIKAGFYGGLQRATVVLFGMGTTMLLAHKAIEPDELGVWSLFLVIAAFVEIMRHGLVKNAVIKFLNSSAPSERGLVLSASLILNVFITTTIGLALFFCRDLIVQFTKAPELGAMIDWYYLALISLILFSHYEWIMLSRVEFRNLFWSYVVRQSVTIILLIINLFLPSPVTLNLLVIYYAAGIFAGGITSYFLYRQELRIRFHYSSQWLLKLWKFGQYAFGTGLSNLVFRSTDTFLVSNILASTAIVAQQGIAVRVFNMADIPSQLMGDILFPKSSALSPDNKAAVKYYYEKSVGATLAIILPATLFVVLFPDLLIMVLAGPKYLDAVPYLRLLMLVSLFLCFLKQFGTIIDSTGKPRINFVFTTVMAVLNIVTCYYFISMSGLRGAAFGLIATHTLAFIVSQTILYKMFGVRFLNSFKYAFSFYPIIGRNLHAKLLNHRTKNVI